ncbi:MULTISPECIES: porin family protein [unclassified Marinobacter]|uniref:porin family protein n=1 Tax=unclassified Marinobacter TaxID=83889 RepID=UPI000C01B3A0|nr:MULTISPECIES: porin family protein [unclassified Marinobacter]PFG11088.1 opacity protein-like surface antigen [Marinobacter sp. LV10MA510-1]PFG52980.1 opacity protein-like surface antigen [Marinobacter sp. LV10R520-4]
MNHTKKSLISAFVIGSATILGAGTAQAQNGYAGANLNFLEYNENGINDDASLTAGTFRLGAQVNEYLSGELRAGLGFSDDTVNITGTDVDIELDSLFGAYLRGGFPITKQIYPYAVFGVTRGQVTYSAQGFSESKSETDTSFGVGVDFTLIDQVTLNVEYMSWFDKDGTEIDGFSVGASTAF